MYYINFLTWSRRSARHVIHGLGLQVRELIVIKYLQVDETELMITQDNVEEVEVTGEQILGRKALILKELKEILALEEKFSKKEQKFIFIHTAGTHRYLEYKSLIDGRHKSEIVREAIERMALEDKVYQRELRNIAL